MSDEPNVIHPNRELTDEDRAELRRLWAESYVGQLGTIRSECRLLWLDLRETAPFRACFWLLDRLARLVERNP